MAIWNATQPPFPLRRILNLLYNQMEQESLSLILDADKMRQMYFKGWKRIWETNLNNKNQFTWFRLRPNFSDCTGPEGRGKLCSQLFGLGWKKSTAWEVKITWSSQCPRFVWAGCQPPGHRVNILSGNPPCSQEYGWKEVNHPFCYFPQDSWGVSTKQQQHCLHLCWVGTTQGNLGEQMCNFKCENTSVSENSS